MVEAVNYNSPGQVVIAGQPRAVERAIAAAKARGAKRAMLLPVSVPAHSQPHARRGRAPARAPGAPRACALPRIRYVSAVDAAEHAEPADIRAAPGAPAGQPGALDGHGAGASAAGIAQIIECGPGKVLTGLNRRIERRAELAFHALEDPAASMRPLAATRGES